MAFHYIWLSANPELEEPLRRANEARAAAFYAAWRGAVRALGVPFRRLGAAIRTARRAQRTRRELSALSDRQLEDIGLVRAEIADIARAVAEEPPEVGVTLANLRQRDAASGTPRIGSRRGRAAPWTARRPTPARQSQRAA